MKTKLAGTNQFFFYMAAVLPFLVLVYSPFSLAIHQSYSPLLKEEEEYLYIVHMNPSAMPTPFTSHHEWHKSMLQSSASTSSKHSEPIYTYDAAMHGFCAKLSSSEVTKLKQMHGYVHSTRVPAESSIELHTTQTPQFLGLTKDKGIWPVAAYGEPVIIGLVDTGIWPESPSYRDDGYGPVPSTWKGSCGDTTGFNNSLCNNKLIGAKFFNKGLLSKDPNVTLKFNSTRDFAGHGTHTSSTAAGSPVPEASYFGYASGTAIGMAPKARVAMYKAMWKAGTDLCDVLAAANEAIKDGVNILSLSLGSTKSIPFDEDPIAIATFAAMEKGIFVAASAGNSGPSLMTLHNGAPWVLTVAAGTIDRQFRRDLILGNGLSASGQSLYVVTEMTNLTSFKPLVYLGFSCNVTEEVRRVATNELLVCEEDPSNSSTLGQQVETVAIASVASGVVFICNFSILDTFYLRTPFPATFVDSKAGVDIKNYINGHASGTATARIDFQHTEVGIKPAPIVARYSSRGPDMRYPSVLKPDLMAPGDMVLASWPDNLQLMSSNIVDDSEITSSKFNLLSGTSMACPHVAGVAALLKAAQPNWSPAAIRSALMTTASITDNSGSPITEATEKGFAIATPFAVGSGHIQPNAALDPGLVYDMGSEDYLSHLCSLNFTPNQLQAITGRASNYCLKVSKAFQLNYPSFMVFINKQDFQPGKIVYKFTRTLTNVGAPDAIYTANVTTVDGFEIHVMPSRLSFNTKKDKRVFQVTVKCRTRLPEDDAQLIKFGYLTWIENSPGSHTVRSPVVITALETA